MEEKNSSSQGCGSDHSGSRDEAAVGATAALAKQAAFDLARYTANMARPDGWEFCAQLEQDWGLYGYPPQVVSTVLQAVSEGVDFDVAESRVLGLGGDA